MGGSGIKRGCFGNQEGCPIVQAREDSEEGTESLESGDPAGGWKVSS